MRTILRELCEGLATLAVKFFLMAQRQPCNRRDRNDKWIVDF